MSVCVSVCVSVRVSVSVCIKIIYETQTEEFAYSRSRCFFFPINFLLKKRIREVRMFFYVVNLCFLIFLKKIEEYALLMSGKVDADGLSLK